MAVGVAELTGGVHGVPCVGGGAVTAGGGVHDRGRRAGGACAEIEAGPLAVFEMDGCHATPGPRLFALRDSSSALTQPYARQPITMQISAQSKATPKSNPNPRSTVKLAQYHSRKYFRINSFE